MGNCLSHLQLARFMTDDLSESEAATVRAHLEACEKCRAVSKQMDVNAAAYSAHEELHLERLDERLAAASAERGVGSRGRNVAIFCGLAAAAAAVLVLTFVFNAGQDESAGDSVIAFKGSSALAVTAARDGETFAVKEGTHLRAGDAVRFTLTAFHSGYVTVFSVDGKGTVSPFYPAAALSENAAPLEIPAAGKHTLPGSIVLDDAPGPERFVALFSERPFDRSAMVDRSTKALQSGDFTALGPSIWVQSVVVEKETLSGP